MQIPVLVEPAPGSRYRAKGGSPFDLEAEGATPEEALGELRALIEQRMKSGTRLVPLELPPEEHSWAPFAGMFADDPLFDEWQEAIREYRGT